jgi:eukaryotic-like serine/threonine-protein kinase
MADGQHKPAEADAKGPPAAELPVSPASPGLDATVTATEAESPAAKSAQDTLHASPSGPGASSDSLTLGTAIGRYVLIDQVGSGAMGVVYAAYDHGLDRKVAVKLLRHPERGAGRRRLQREAQALARLSHPNVVAVHDIGTYRDQVFVAMEYVEGRDLRRWLTDEPRTWRQVLDVFRRAGDGLAAAHAVGIVHRDFKPDNVLIDRHGRVQVGDFGLALVGRDLVDSGDGGAASGSSSSGEPILTATGAAVGTPAYMSPEQHVGSRNIDARADQFSYCVALYEALHGARPFEGESVLALYEQIEAGTVREPPRDSPVPPWLHRAVVRGLAADPAARHPSMDALLSELRRDRTVWRRRAIAATAAAVLLGGGLALGSTSGWFAAGEDMCGGAGARLAGVWDAARAAELRSAFLATGSSAAEVQATTAIRYLDHYGERWAAMRRDSCEATHVRGDQSSEVLDLRTACLDRRLGELRAVAASLLRADREMVAQATEATRTLSPLSSCANVTALTGQVAPGDEAKSRLAHEKYGAARATMLSGKWKESIPMFREVLAEAHAAADPALRAVALVDLADVERMVGDAKVAEDLAYQALAAADVARAGETTVKAWIELMKVHGQEGARFEEAHRMARVARSVLERIGGSPLLEAALELEVGDTYLNQGKPNVARGHLERAVALRERSGERPEISEVPTALSQLSMLEGRQGNHVKALELRTRARQLLQEAYGPEHPDVVRLMLNEAVALESVGREDEAFEIYERGLALTKNGEGERSIVAATYRNNIGSILTGRGKLAEGLVEFEAARDIYAEVLGAKDSNVAASDLNVASLLSELGRHDEAIARIEGALKMFEAELGQDHPDVADSLASLARAHLAAGKPAAALAPLEKALKICEKLDGDPEIRSMAQFLLAQALVALGRDRGRALALAEASRAGFVQANEKDSLAELDEWQAKHAPGSKSSVSKR